MNWMFYGTQTVSSIAGWEEGEASDTLSSIT
jgi:hypothetical protein